MYARAVPLLGAALALAACRPPTGTSDPTVWSPGKGRKSPVVMQRAEPSTGEPAGVFEVLQRELTTNLAQLQADGVEPPVYYLGYDLVDDDSLRIAAEDGALVRNELGRNRMIDVDVRVGDHGLDNSHSRNGNYGPGNGLGSGLPVSLSDEPLSLSQSLWLDTEAQYHDAVATLREIESDEQLRSEDEQEHPDFSREKPIVHVEPEVSLPLSELRARFRDDVLEVSRVLADDVQVLGSGVSFSASAENHYFVSSEGSRAQSGRTRLRVAMHAYAQADDGMMLSRSATFEAHHPEELPSREQLEASARRLREELLALREAPIAEPYTGPAVLEGRAAGVFFHEIFGHRLEGHRQKDDLEGQTFTGQLGKKILPTFLDVIDDPTVVRLGATPLSGHYFVDDEAVLARRTVLVERGKLKNFLLSRSVVLPFRHSNGHGRREPGYPVVARQGNLIVTSRRALSSKALRAELIEEVKRQGKPYGLLFKDIEGGYTLTDRSGPQAFKVTPLMVYKVYPDGRPDELVRGVEIVGTPLSAFETILATDDTPGIFNGMCGAESGWVPVSAVSPSLLLRQIEIERSIHDRNKPPLLEPPMEAEPNGEPAEHDAKAVTQ